MTKFWPRHKVGAIAVLVALLLALLASMVTNFSLFSESSGFPNNGCFSEDIPTLTPWKVEQLRTDLDQPVTKFVTESQSYGKQVWLNFVGSKDNFVVHVVYKYHANQELFAAFTLTAQEWNFLSDPNVMIRSKDSIINLIDSQFSAIESEDSGRIQGIGRDEIKNHLNGWNGKC